MKIIRNLESMRKERSPVFLAAGFFDGVHSGHRRVIERTIARAKKRGGVAWVLTFDRHPLMVLRPERTPPLLTCNPHKLKLLSRLALDGCLLLPFTRRLAQVEPERFILRLSRCLPTLAEIWVGENWRFGRGGKGDVALLSARAAPLGFTVKIVKPLMWRGRPVSSTRIRVEIRKGRLEEAAAMLGHPVCILGTVRRGRGVGRSLGFPTANLSTSNEVLPPRGVYGVRALWKETLYNGVLNLGTRPTFTGPCEKACFMELHLLDFEGDLYGEQLEVLFFKKIRSERQFPSPSALKTRIARDVETARRWFAEKKKRITLHVRGCHYIVRSQEQKKETRTKDQQG